MKNKQAFVIGPAADIPAGGRKLVDIAGKSIGLFNVGGTFYALLNYCPHYGGALCEGPVTGTTLPTDEFRFVYGRAGAVLRCAWHGWEFDITTGELLIDPRIRARSFPVTVNPAGELVVHLGGKRPHKESEL